MTETLPKKVVICTPTITKPHQPYLDSLAASVPSLEAAGWAHATVFEVGCPYISHARSKLLRKAINADATAVIFIDHDLSWQPDALLRLLEAEGDVVAGTYRFKREPEEYMGSLMTDADGSVLERDDGCLEAHSIPAGFLKITREGVNRFMRDWPELTFGEACNPHTDLFNHGAHAGVWWGEDYAFARRWREKCGTVWLVPDLQIDHHSDMSYPGNYALFLRRQPGGDLHEAG
jgi:hypothetical protein